MNVFFAANEGYLEPLRTALLSLFLHNASESLPVRAHVLSAQAFSPEAQAAAQEIAGRFPGASLEFHVESADFAKEFAHTIPYISAETWLRLRIPEAFPEIDRALYLDADLICTGSLRGIWETDLQGALIAGARDVWIGKAADWRFPELGFGCDELCVNAGVLLLDCRAMRRERSFERMTEAARTHGELMRYQDQDVISWALRGRIRELPPEANVCSPSHGGAELFSRAAVLHCTGPVKPWKAPFFRCGPAQLRWYAVERLVSPERFRSLTANPENWNTPRACWRSFRRMVWILCECARLRRRARRTAAGD